MKLYELKSEYCLLLDKFREAEDEQMLAEIADELATLQGTLEDKLDSCARVYRTLEAEADIYEQEANRLRGKANILGNRASRLKDYIGHCLGVGNKAKTELFDFRWLKSESVEVVDPELIPKQYQRIKTVVEPDKVLIKQDLKCEAVVPGVKLVTKYNLQIK